MSSPHITDVDQIQNCLNNTWGAAGSDTLISLCLWDAGFAFTDPGEWVARGPRKGVPDPEYGVFVSSTTT